MREWARRGPSRGVWRGSGHDTGVSLSSLRVRAIQCEVAYIEVLSRSGALIVADYRSDWSQGGCSAVTAALRPVRRAVRELVVLDTQNRPHAWLDVVP